ncbi:MAG: hypothetical protein JO247_07580, partial [Chloroflexi bacterium]|nr:hypothetical protein [Chloroflexota bacterium]
MLKVFAGVLEDEIGWLFRASPREDARLFHALALEAELSPAQLVGNAWQNHLLDRLLADENAFSLKAQIRGQPGPGLRAAVEDDLAKLRQLFDQSLELGELTPAGDRPPDGIKIELAKTNDWRRMVEPLAAHYR